MRGLPIVKSQLSLLTAPPFSPLVSRFLLCYDRALVHACLCLTGPAVVGDLGLGRKFVGISTK
jgi:hypothetical protein